MIKIILAFSLALCVTGCAHFGVETNTETETVQENLTTTTSANNTEADSATRHELLGPTTDLWSRIRNRFSLEEYSHPRIDKQLAWYSRHQQYMDRVADRAAPYMHFIVETLEQENIPSEMALLPIVESAFQPFAYSHGRAAGIWQFIPATGKRYGLKQNWWYDGRRDVHASTIAAVKFLKALAKEFDGDWMLALAAYNSGSGTVRKAIRLNKRKGKPTDFFSLDLPAETEAYVPKLLALKSIMANPDAYNLTLKPIPNQSYFKLVDVGSQIDLALAAEMAEIPINDLYALNPGHNRWATPPNGPHHLLLPNEKAYVFQQRLEELPEQQRINWVRHKIKEGETLSTIAVKYHTSISVIKRVNHIRGKTIRAGQSITIPVAKKSLRSYKLSANQRRSQKQNVPRQGIKVTHIVQEGDTFWDLSRLHNVGVRQLAKWNSMAPRDPLVPGTKLVIWSRTGKEVSHNDPGEIQIPENRQIMKRIGYTVRNGDSLARISQKFKVSVNQVLRWNKLNPEKVLRPGQFLTLFVDVTRQSGI